MVTGNLSLTTLVTDVFPASDHALRAAVRRHGAQTGNLGSWRRVENCQRLFGDRLHTAAPLKPSLVSESLETSATRGAVHDAERHVSFLTKD